MNIIGLRCKWQQSEYLTQCSQRRVFRRAHRSDEQGPVEWLWCSLEGMQRVMEWFFFRKGEDGEDSWKVGGVVIWEESLNESVDVELVNAV